MIVRPVTYMGSFYVEAELTAAELVVQEKGVVMQGIRRMRGLTIAI